MPSPSASSTRPSGCIAQAAAADPRNSIAVVGLARVALERGDEPAAWRQSMRALEIDPENVAAQPAGRAARGGLGVPRAVAARPARRPEEAAGDDEDDRMHGEGLAMKVLVTGGAGYVGGVSVDALLAAGPRRGGARRPDDGPCGRRPAGGPARARLVRGRGGGPGPAGRRGRRRDPPLRRALARRRERRGPREVLPRQRRGRRRPARGRPGGRRPACRLLVDGGGLRRARVHAHPRGRGARARSTPTARPSARSRAPSAGTAAPTGSGA